jgi:hypothetical protein
MSHDTQVSSAGQLIALVVGSLMLGLGSALVFNVGTYYVVP